MDYYDIYSAERQGVSRPEINKQILDHFGNIDNTDIAIARERADIRSYYESPICDLFLATCIQQGRAWNEDSQGMDSEDAEELFDSLAENCVPVQTYVIYNLWIEFGYETDGFQDIGLDSVALDQIENCAQYQLLKYAERVITFVDMTGGDMDRPDADPSPYAR